MATNLASSLRFNTGYTRPLRECRQAPPAARCFLRARLDCGQKAVRPAPVRPVLLRRKYRLAKETRVVPPTQAFTPPAVRPVSIRRNYCATLISSGKLGPIFHCPEASNRQDLALLRMGSALDLLPYLSVFMG